MPVKSKYQSMNSIMPMLGVKVKDISLPNLFEIDFPPGVFNLGYKNGILGKNRRRDSSSEL